MSNVHNLSKSAREEQSTIRLGSQPMKILKQVRDKNSLIAAALESNYELHEGNNYELHEGSSCVIL